MSGVSTPELPPLPKPSVRCGDYAGPPGEGASENLWDSDEMQAYARAAVEAALSHPAVPLRLEACDAAASAKRLFPMRPADRDASLAQFTRAFNAGKAAGRGESLNEVAQWRAYAQHCQRVTAALKRKMTAEQVLEHLDEQMAASIERMKEADTSDIDPDLLAYAEEVLGAPSPAPAPHASQAQAGKDIDVAIRDYAAACYNHDGIGMSKGYVALRDLCAVGGHATQEATRQDERDAAYDKIDRFLRNNLDDGDYAEYSAALDAMSSTPGAQP